MAAGIQFIELEKGYYLCSSMPFLMVIINNDACSWLSDLRKIKFTTVTKPATIADRGFVLRPHDTQYLSHEGMDGTKVAVDL